MEKANIDGVVLENWQENTLELARRNGLPESSIVISPSKIGKTEMLQIAQQLLWSKIYYPERETFFLSCDLAPSAN